MNGPPQGGRNRSKEHRVCGVQLAEWALLFNGEGTELCGVAADQPDGC